MYSRSRNIIKPCICVAFFLLLAGTVSAADHYSVNIPPGGYAWSFFSQSHAFSDFETVNVIAPGPLHGFSSVLPDTALQAIQLSEEWLQSDLSLKFTDLLYLEVYSEFPVVPAFADVNGDGLEDLVLESGSSLRAFVAPNWVEVAEFARSVELIRTCDLDNDGVADSSFLSDQGELTLYSEGLHLQATAGYDISNVTGTALGDMEGDGLADLVVGTEAGNVLVFRNRGTVDIPCFQPFYSESQTFFPMNPGAFSSPAMLLIDDSLLVLAAGTRQNGLCYYVSETGDDYLVPGWSVLNTVENHSGYLNISPVTADLSGERILICGTRDGMLYEGIPSSDSLRLLDLPPVPGTYPNLAVTLVNGDEFPDLVAGTMEGGVFFLSGLDGWFHGNWAPVEGIPAIPSGAPASWENGLVFGSADGTLRYFTPSSGGEWIDATEGSEFSLIDVGEYSTPLFFDVNNDGMEELVSGNSTGSLYFFERSGIDSPFQENFSWAFQPNGGVPSIESYYSRYFTPYSVFRSPSGFSAVNSFAGEIINAHPGYRDEIAFCIATTPVDILRVMEENGDADVFNLNAESLYDAAEKLNYVRLTDSEQGTSCEVKTADGWFEISRENYYRFVVHPRILFEVPGKIDATYWNTPWDSLAMSEREYLNYETDSLFGHSPDHVFWRQFIPSDSIRGRTLEQRMIEADTYDEAVVTLCNFQSHSQPGGMMSFGYQTNDLQPMTIYGKAYGSCGEQSILQTALCRAFFVPAYVVGCRGEDHQWNQYLDPASEKWNHWDVNYGVSGIGNVWISGEGVDHKGKTISTISAFGPAGRVWPVTGDVLVPIGSGYMEGDSGYTRTATVEILVTDPPGQPVEGAMVLVKSHWNNANAITVFDYTDRSGLCVFDLGWEPNGGYTIDVISAYGSAGSMNIGFNENSHYSVNYTVPYNIPQRQEISLVDPGSSASIPVVEKFYPVPYFTGSLYSIDSDENEDFIRNSDWVPWREIESTGSVFYMDGDNFRSYRNGRSCNATGYPFVPDEGDSCFAVLDNRNSMFTWIEYEAPPAMHLQVENAPVSLEDHREDRLPVAGSGFLNNSFEFSQNGVHWINSYPNMEIHQDDPDDPLSSDLVIGPFKIPSGERNLSIGTSSETANLDLDLFLFMDRNGNRAVDGMSELLTSSTSATSSEIVFITEPDTSAAYWIYLHGWQVGESSGEIHLGLSFQPDMIAAHSLSPMGYQMILPQQFSFATVDSFNPGDIYLKSGETVIYPGKQEELWYFETDSPSEFFADGAVNLFHSSGELIEEFQWNFSLDSIPPEFTIDSRGIDHATMLGIIQVVCEDSLSGIERVTLSADSTSSIELVLRGDTAWSGTVDFLPFSGETVSLEVCVVDLAGNETRKNFQMTTVSRPEVVFSSIYPSETGRVYDHTPVLQVFVDFENTVSGWTAEATVHGQVLEPVIDGEIIQFFVKDFLPDGEHRAKIQILSPDGETIGEYRWTFTVGTMTSTI